MAEDSKTPPSQLPPNGITLRGQRFEQISGPISFFYLKPQEDAYEEYRAQGITLPLVLLFGDRHYSREDACQPCEAPTCTTLSGEHWLSTLDKMAEEIPVDFFTETAPWMERRIQRRQGETGFLFGDFFQPAFLDCRDPQKRKNQSSTCPTTHIRWHNADARFMPFTAEGYIMTPLESVLNEVLHRTPPSSPSLPLPPMERTYYVKTTNTPKARHYYLEVNQWLKDALPRWFTASDAKSFRLTAMEDTLTYLESSHRPHRQSAIFKQLERMKGSKVDDVSFWVSLMKTYLTHYTGPTFDKVYSRLTRVDALKENLVEYIRAIPILDTDPSVPLASYVPTKGVTADLLLAALSAFYDSFWIPMNAFLLDMYTLLRMIKPPHQNLTGIVSLGFFGNAHTEWMVFALHQIGYDIVYHDIDPQNRRCRTLTKPIPFWQDLKEFARRQIQTEEDKERYRVYQRESAARKAARTRTNSLPTSPVPPISSKKRKANTMNRKKNRNNKNNVERYNWSNSGNNKNRTKTSKKGKGTSI